MFTVGYQLRKRNENFTPTAEKSVHIQSSVLLRVALADSNATLLAATARGDRGWLMQGQVDAEGIK